jgi:hypothetical protein
MEGAEDAYDRALPADALENSASPCAMSALVASKSVDEG